MRADEPGRRAEAQGDRCADFERFLPLVDDVTSHVCRRQCLRAEEAEDFASSVKVYLLEDDCAVLRGFNGRSSLSTYLTTVILNLARDERVRRWGRWRPSAAAQRLGVVAVQLETLTVRDGRSFRDAVEILQRHHEVDLTAVELADLAAQFPSRANRRFEGEDSLANLAAAESAETCARDAERAAMLAKTQRVVPEVLATLTAEDRLLLKLRFKDGLKISAIAGALGLRSKRLYPRLQALLCRLRRELRDRGLSAEEALGSLGWSGSDLDFDYSLAPEVEPQDRPSN